MNGVHDLGGTDGLGHRPSPPGVRAGLERGVGEARVRDVLACFRAGFFGVDAFRYGIEQMHPAAYLLSPYYEHWAHAVEHYGVARGCSTTEIDKRMQFFLENPDAPMPEREDPDLLAFVDGVVKAGAPAGRPSDKVAKFAVGDRVTVAPTCPVATPARPSTCADARASSSSPTAR